MDQFDPWQVVPRQAFTPYDCLLKSVVFVVLCCVGFMAMLETHCRKILLSVFQAFTALKSYYLLQILIIYAFNYQQNKSAHLYFCYAFS